jgi:hypothetical protein
VRPGVIERSNGNWPSASERFATVFAAGSMAIKYRIELVNHEARLAELASRLNEHVRKAVERDRDKN